jgi:hypothetical protein
MSKYNLIDIYEQYRIGSGWTNDFDYDGMLKTGLGTSIDTPIRVLKQIFEDFTDVNYHREAEHLSYAIDAIEIGDMVEAESRLNNFHDEIRKTQIEQGMDIEPTVGQFMASKMEEGKDKDKEPRDGVKSAAAKLGIKPSHVKEVTSREGARIEGLLDINMKEQFLDAFEDLYFNLVEEDPFAAEDVVDHLANEMLKHLDAIQAQGDKLNQAGNPSVEFTPGERIGEEDNIDEAEKRDIRTALKQDAKGTDAEIDQYFTSLMKAGDEFDTMEDYVEDFKNYIADKSLQEHFGRFMKDYQ